MRGHHRRSEVADTMKRGLPAEGGRPELARGRREFGRNGEGGERLGPGAEYSGRRRNGQPRMGTAHDRPIRQASGTPAVPAIEEQLRAVGAIPQAGLGGGLPRGAGHRPGDQAHGGRLRMLVRAVRWRGCPTAVEGRAFQFRATGFGRHGWPVSPPEKRARLGKYPRHSFIGPPPHLILWATDGQEKERRKSNAPSVFQGSQNPEYIRVGLDRPARLREYVAGRAFGGIVRGDRRRERAHRGASDNRVSMEGRWGCGASSARRAEVVA